MKEPVQRAKTMKAAAGIRPSPEWITLNARLQSDEAGLFEQQLLARIVAQESAVRVSQVEYSASADRHAPVSWPYRLGEDTGCRSCG
jgi:hypothetical protein